MPWTDPKTWVLRELVTPDDMNTQLRDNLRYLTGEMPVGIGYLSGGGCTTSATFVEMNPSLRVTLTIPGTRLLALLSFQLAIGAEVAAGGRIELALDNTTFTGTLHTMNGKSTADTLYWCTIHRLFTGLTPGTHSLIPRMASITAGNNYFGYGHVYLTVWGL
jgi:hypothetical protein